MKQGVGSKATGRQFETAFVLDLCCKPVGSPLPYPSSSLIASQTGTPRNAARVCILLQASLTAMPDHVEPAPIMHDDIEFIVPARATLTAT